MNDIDYAELIDGLNIERGDVIDVASDMASTLMYYRGLGHKLDPEKLIDMLKCAVGDEGTVMIRTFNWDFCHNVPFDISKSPSRVGALGNKAIKRTDFKRTAHPIYSWMVWGKYTDELTAMDNTSSFDRKGPFGFLYDHGAKQLTIGTTSGDSCTQMHYVEAMENVPYRYDKPFTADYTDINGTTVPKTYSMHVRPLNLHVQNANFNEGYRKDTLLKKGIMKWKDLNENMSCSSMLLHELTDFLIEDMRTNGGEFTVEDILGKPGYVTQNIDWSEMKFL